MKIHYLQHVPFEAPGYIETWAKERNYTVTSTKFYEKFDLPAQKDFDMLVVMGGPMSVNKEEKYPWLRLEKIFIKESINSGKIVLGICLGSQLIAEVLGAKVYPNIKKEIGWFPVYIENSVSGNALLKGFPHSFTVMHWHGDTYDLPGNSLHLMHSDICKNQAFLYNNQVLALQFHLEMTQSNLKSIVESCGDELVPDDYIQTPGEILNAGDRCAGINKYLVILLDNLVAAADSDL